MAFNKMQIFAGGFNDQAQKSAVMLPEIKSARSEQLCRAPAVNVS
jgi:hypothetical protein